jgi:hypothetical protein
MPEESKKNGAPDGQSETDSTSPITLDEVTLETGEVDFHDADGVVSGNIFRGAVLRGRGNLAVEGGIEGAVGSRAVVEILGDVTIDQSVIGAKISARNIVISGDISECTIQAEGYLEVHGTLLKSVVSVGSRASMIRSLNQKRSTIRTVNQKISELSVQTSSAARKFVRDYPQVDLKMGNILDPGKRELFVRLDQFYSAVGSADTAKIDKALEEFFLRVVVGMLKRNNREYVSRNPSRHKIFLKLIDELRVHILKIRELDKLLEGRVALSEGSDLLIQKMQDPGSEPYLRVGGSLKEGAVVTLIRLSGFQEGQNGAIDIEQKSVEGRIVQLPDGGNLVMEVTGATGIKSNIVPTEGGFQNGIISIWEDDLVWKAS